MILLYGAPGTGKTESAMQWARETGRDIIHVDISASKSLWYGESEKIIKEIFKVAPLLSTAKFNSQQSRIMD